MKDQYNGSLSYEDQPEVRLAQYGLVSRESVERLERFAGDITTCLDRRLEGLYSLISRLKTPKSILQKTRRMTSKIPIYDIYGVRVAIPEWAKQTASIDLHWHSVKTTPDLLPGGIKSDRITGQIASIRGFKARSINFVIDEERIGEVQIMTPEELLVEAITRDEYKKYQEPLIVRYVDKFFATISSAKGYQDFERRQILEDLKNEKSDQD